MLKHTYDNQHCSVARTLEVVGERWTLLIVRDLLTGLARFEQFRRSLGVTASVLSARLDGLVRAGVTERVPYQAGPTRYEYRLTPMGRELAVIVVALMQWGDRHLVDSGEPPLTCHHSVCGGAVDVTFVCRGCDTDIGIGEVGINYARQARR